MSPPTTGLQNAQYQVMARRFPRKKTFFAHFFSEQADCMYSKSCLWKKSCKYSKIWLHLWTNSKSCSTPKVDPILKSNYKAATRITDVFLTKVQMFTPFLGDKPWNLALVLFEPLPQPLTNVFSSAGKFCISCTTEISLKKTKQKNKIYLATKKKKRQRLGTGS